MKPNNKGYSISMSVIIILMITMLLVLFTSCTATRTITNSAEYQQKGDTTIIIQTKTIENYKAKKQ